MSNAKNESGLNALLCCPFCGESAELYENDDAEVYVCCVECCARGEYFNVTAQFPKEMAIEAWNRRAV